MNKNFKAILPHITQINLFFIEKGTIIAPLLEEINPRTKKIKR